jgi:hypothetical protein
MLENDLRLPFETQILGVTASVESVDITGDDQLVAVCRKGKTEQRISLSELPLPSLPPDGAEWILAYRYWLTGAVMSNKSRAAKRGRAKMKACGRTCGQRSITSRRLLTLTVNTTIV